jgi:hypothetical protein
MCPRNDTFSNQNSHFLSLAYNSPVVCLCTLLHVSQLSSNFVVLQGWVCISQTHNMHPHALLFTMLSGGIYSLWGKTHLDCAGWCGRTEIHAEWGIHIFFFFSIQSGVSTLDVRDSTSRLKHYLFSFFKKLAKILGPLQAQFSVHLFYYPSWAIRPIFKFCSSKAHITSRNFFVFKAHSFGLIFSPILSLKNFGPIWNQNIDLGLQNPKTLLMFKFITE